MVFSGFFLNANTIVVICYGMKKLSLEFLFHFSNILVKKNIYCKRYQKKIKVCLFNRYTIIFKIKF